MSAQLLAWMVILAAACGAAALAFLALRRWSRLRWLAAAWVLAWTATPFPVNDGHVAPALVVFFFRAFLEEEANARPPLALLVLATGMVAAIYAIARLINWGVGQGRAPRRARSSGR